MQIFYWNQISQAANFFSQKKSGISIGSFDGLHQGHKTLINKLIKGCKEKNLLSGIITFTRPLPSIKSSKDYEGDLSTLQNRLTAFENSGIDFVIIVDFTQEFASLSGAEFFTKLIDLFNMKYLVEGVDFRCGYKGATDSRLIKIFCDENNIAVDFVSPVFYKDDRIEKCRISSSIIRKLVQKGDFTSVNGMLDRQYTLDLLNLDSTVIERSSVNQVMPNSGVFECKNEKNNTVKVEFNKNQIILSEVSSTLFFI